MSKIFKITKILLAVFLDSTPCRLLQTFRSSLSWCQYLHLVRGLGETISVLLNTKIWVI
jgi:hypothetical protein